MQKNTQAFTEHCIKDRGYSEKDFLICDYTNAITKKLESSEQTLIVEKKDWSYDTFDSDVDKLKNTSAPRIVFTDGNRFFHIFVRDHNGNYVEVSELPGNNQSKSTEEENKFREKLSSTLWQYSNKNRGYFDREKIGDLFFVAVQIARDGEWETFRELIDDPERLLEYIQKKKESISSTYPLIFSTSREVDSIEVYRSMVLFEGLDFDEFPGTVADLYMKVFRNRYDGGISSELAGLMTSFKNGKTAVLSGDLSRFVIELAKSDANDSELYTQFVFVQKICYLCGYSPEIRYQWNITGMYDTIIAAPPFGVMDRSPVEFDSVYGDKPRDLVARIIEESVYHLNEGGRIVALVPMGFLFKATEARLREKLNRDYHVSFVQVLKKALEPASGIDTALLVIENKSSKGCMSSTEPVPMGEYESVSRKIHEYLSSGVVSEGYFMVDNRIMKESWVPLRLFVDSTNKEKDPADDVLLSEVATLISGVQINSSEYIKPDSFGGIPYVRVSDYGPNGINLDKAVRVPGKYAKVLPEKGDILFSITATIGKMAIVDEEVFVLGSQSVLIRPNPQFDSKKIMDALSTDDVALQISSMQTGITIRHLSRSSLGNVRLDRRRLC